jgi:hypothetical protein
MSAVATELATAPHTDRYVSAVGPVARRTVIEGKSLDLRCLRAIDQVLARDLRMGDVVRLDDPQAHRVERVMIVDARVVLELRPVGLSLPGTVRLDLPADAAVERLGSAAS